MGLDRDLGQLCPPERLNSLHQIETFDSGNSQLDEWLKRRALKNESEGASRTYVLCDRQAVIAYYSNPKSFVNFLLPPLAKGRAGVG